jgi:hypothetical protein
MTSRLAFTLAFASVAGCSGATLGGSSGEDAAVGADARIDAAVGADAPVDATPCMGGDQAQRAPDGSCLVMIATPVTYADAQTACDGLGGHLAYLEDAQLDTFAEDFIGTVDTWIGGDDLVTEMSFQWNDGTAFNFTNWHTGEPNNGGDGTYEEDCAIIAGSRVGKQWDDRPCDDSVITTSGKFATLCQY